MLGRWQIRRAVGVLSATVLCSLACGLTDSGSTNFDDVDQGVGAAFVETGTNDVILINTDGTHFVTFDSATGEFSDSQPIEELGDGFPFEGVTAASEFTEVVPNRPIVVDEDGARAAVREIGGETYGDDDELSVFTPNLPFESVGAIVTISGNMIVFDDTGNTYAVYITASNTYTATFDFDTNGLLGAPATIADVGACFLSPATGTELFMFDVTGKSFAIFNTGTSSFGIRQSLNFFGDGSLEF